MNLTVTLELTKKCEVICINIVVIKVKVTVAYCIPLVLYIQVICTVIIFLVIL